MSGSGLSGEPNVCIPHTRQPSRGERYPAPRSEATESAGKNNPVPTWSRRGGPARERATGLEPATSSLGSEQAQLREAPTAVNQPLQTPAPLVRRLGARSFVTEIVNRHPA